MRDLLIRLAAGGILRLSQRRGHLVVGPRFLDAGEDVDETPDEDDAHHHDEAHDLAVERAAIGHRDQRPDEPHDQRQRDRAEERDEPFGGEDAENALHCPLSCLVRTTSVRRFAARPSGVLLDAMGSPSARPSAEISRRSVTLCRSRSRTVSARATDSWKFDGKRSERIGTLSVWPMTSTEPCSLSRAAAMRPMSGRYLSLSVAVPEEKRSLPRMRTIAVCGVPETVTRPALTSGSRKVERRCTSSSRCTGGGASAAMLSVTGPAGGSRANLSDTLSDRSLRRKTKTT